MATRVLSGDAAGSVQPVPWKAVASPCDEAPPDANEQPAVQGELEALREQFAQAEREFQQREQQAFAAGFRKGETAGREQAAARLDSVIEQFARTVNEVSQMRRKTRRDAEQDVVKLALAIARRVLHREMSLDREAIIGVVKAALDKLEGREVDRIHVNPEDAEAVKKYLQQTGPPRGIEVIADQRLGRGAAIFESARGKLDASVDTQLEEIQRGLADKLRQWQ